MGNWGRLLRGFGLWRRDYNADPACRELLGGDRDHNITVDWWVPPGDGLGLSLGEQASDVVNWLFSWFPGSGIFQKRTKVGFT